METQKAIIFSKPFKSSGAPKNSQLNALVAFFLANLRRLANMLSKNSPKDLFLGITSQPWRTASGTGFYSNLGSDQLANVFKSMKTSNHNWFAFNGCIFKDIEKSFLQFGTDKKLFKVYIEKTDLIIWKLKNMLNVALSG